MIYIQTPTEGGQGDWCLLPSTAAQGQGGHGVQAGPRTDPLPRHDTSTPKVIRKKKKQNKMADQADKMGNNKLPWHHIPNPWSSWDDCRIGFEGTNEETNLRPNRTHTERKLSQTKCKMLHSISVERTVHAPSNLWLIHSLLPAWKRSLDRLLQTRRILFQTWSKIKTSMASPPLSHPTLNIRIISPLPP